MEKEHAEELAKPLRRADLPLGVALAQRVFSLCTQSKVDPQECCLYSCIFSAATSRLPDVVTVVAGGRTNPSTKGVDTNQKKERKKPP